MAAGTHPYDLPAGKEYHIFIACSGEDSEKGRWLMEQLESRYPFRCVYHERDFLAGAIVDNMRDFMDKSVKCLLLISQVSLNNFHSTLERTFAISISNETGQNYIIPVLLEEVPLPPVLRHMTYIDWRPHIQEDVVARIREAYFHSGDDNGKPIGYIKCYHDSPYCCGCRLKFENSNLNFEDIDQETKGHASLIFIILFKIIEEMCSDTKEALNSYSGMKCYGLFTMRRMCIGMLIASVVFGVLVVGIYGIYVVANKEVFNGMIIWIPIMVGMLAVPFFYLVFVGAVGKKVRQYLTVLSDFYQGYTQPQRKG
ncbi:unnamed protein product [Mytilus edulis]|uniref:TIR domain-containing protein n=1 Tax=Mytilus edulis TaxID=6550 RepID=A0A8S3U9E4_MYTED|nr:unnamed protein product [Mytilus edulis]